MQRVPENPNYLAERVRDALAHDPALNELDVRVTISGHKVFVTGHVATEERRARIPEVVREVLPDYEVHNQTSVNELTEPTEAEELT